MYRANAAMVAAVVAALAAPLQAQQSLRFELGYTHWPDRGDPHGKGAMFKFVQALGKNPTVAFDAGVIWATEGSAGSAFVIGIDGGVELRLRLVSTVRLLIGGGAGVVSASGEFVTPYPRVSSGVEIGIGHSPISLRAILHTTIPPFPADKSPNSMVLLGAEYRLSQRQ